MSPHDEIGEAAKRTLVLAAERWPEFRELQALLAGPVEAYQKRLITARAVKFALEEESPA